MLIVAPADRVYALYNICLKECERHRNPLILLFGALMIAGAIAPPDGFIIRAVTASATIAGTGGTLGYISEWRDWSE